MSLGARISLLASRVGQEVKTKIDEHHPGVAKAWVCFACVQEQVVIRSSFNVLGVTRTRASKYRITFATAQPHARYCWSAHASYREGSSSARLEPCHVTQRAKTKAYIELICTTTAGVVCDPAELNFHFFR